MSDAKAKAEARRAKILAREKSKTVSAVTAEEDEDLLISLAESKPKERPLAARRSLIENTTAKGDEEVKQNETDKVDVAQKEATSDAAEKKDDATPTSSVPTDSTEGGSKKFKFPPKKTLEEIEREVAENTKKFDEKTLAKGEETENQETSSKNKTDNTESSEKSEKKDKEEKSVTDDKVEKFMNLKKPAYAIEPSTVMRFIRLIFIVAFAFFTGYRVMVRNKVALNQSFVSQEGDEFDLTNAAYQQYQQELNNNTGNRTWIQYFQYRLNSQLESPVSAIILIYWISKMFTPAINSVFKVPKPKASNPLQMVFEFVQNGLSVWMESVYTLLGEISLYFLLLIVSVMFWTSYYAEVSSKELGTSKASSLENNSEL